MQLRKEPDHEEANRLYTMIEPLKREVLEAYSFVRSGRYQQGILLLKNIIEVRVLVVCEFTPMLRTVINHECVTLTHMPIVNFFISY